MLRNGSHYEKGGMPPLTQQAPNMHPTCTPHAPNNAHVLTFFILITHHLREIHLLNVEKWLSLWAMAYHLRRSRDHAFDMWPPCVWHVTTMPLTCDHAFDMWPPCIWHVTTSRLQCLLNLQVRQYFVVNVNHKNIFKQHLCLLFCWEF